MTGIREWIMANLLLLVGGFAALMTVGFIVQTVRLDGLQIDAPFVGRVGPEGWIETAKRFETANKFLRDAQEAAIEMHMKETARIEGDYLVKAKEADDANQKLQDAQLALARKFIANGGVRRERNPGSAGQTAPPAEGGSPESSDGPSDVSLVDGLPEIVNVYATDVEICTVNTSRLLEAQKWGVGLQP